MVVAFLLAMMVVSFLLYRLARKTSPTSSSPRRPGRPDGVRSVYKRGQ